MTDRRTYELRQVPDLPGLVASPPGCAQTSTVAATAAWATGYAVLAARGRCQATASPLFDAGRVEGVVLSHRECTGDCADADGRLGPVQPLVETSRRIAHESRNTLTPALGMLELALDEPALPAHTREDLEVASRGVTRTLEVLDAGSALRGVRAGTESRQRVRELLAGCEHSWGIPQPRDLPAHLAGVATLTWWPGAPGLDPDGSWWREVSRCTGQRLWQVRLAALGAAWTGMMPFPVDQGRAVLALDPEWGLWELPAE